MTSRVSVVAFIPAAALPSFRIRAAGGITAFVVAAAMRVVWGMGEKRCCTGGTTTVVEPSTTRGATATDDGGIVIVVVCMRGVGTPIPTLGGIPFMVASTACRCV